MEIEKYIPQAEKIFLGEGTFKDDRNERIDFIKNLETCDLLAVPGSGKTTALIAKLYCMAQNMPFEDGSGILVLAHTNNAVDEIEKKLKKHCPQLFEYPNFVGTIQSFVNRYLANQACFEKYGSYIRKNEDDLTIEKLSRKIYFDKSSKINSLLSRNLKEKHSILNEDFLENYELDNKKNILEKFRELDFVDKNYQLKSIKENYSRIISSLLSQEERKVLFEFNNQIKNYEPKLTEFIDLVKKIKYDESNECFYSEIFPRKWEKKLKFKTESGKELKEIFEFLRKDGIFKYLDSFEISSKYVTSNINLTTILQKRFKYVFIDEMQDLEDYQIKIIDDIFFAENSKTIIQRIGDKNQAIYNSGKTIKEVCDWKTREQEKTNDKKYKDLSFQSSLRLNPKVANLVDKFVLERPSKDYEVVGKFEESNLRPHLIIIKRDTTGFQLQNKFIELIKNNNLHTCEKNIKNGFKIVSWVTEKEEDNNEIYLQKIFSNYSKKNHSPKEDYKSLKDYLYYFDKQKKTLEAIRKSILNSFTRILDLEEIKDEKGRRIRKSTLMQFVKNQSEEYYNDFKAKLYSWCFRILVHQQNEEVYKEIVSFVKSKDFIGLNWYNIENYQPKTISKSNQFLMSSDFQLKDETTEGLKKKEEIQIDLASIHAVKGQTHCATMYIESYFHNYELNKKKIKECIQGKEHNIKNEKNISQAVQALKMMYVGFSRPTHLLCFVVLEENVKDYLDSVCHTKGGIWEVDKELIQVKA